MLDYFIIIILLFLWGGGGGGVGGLRIGLQLQVRYSLLRVRGCNMPAVVRKVQLPPCRPCQV